VLLAALLLVQTPSASAVPAEVARANEDRRALAAFAALAPAERKEFLEYLALEIRAAGLFQDELVRFVLKQSGRAPADFPEAVEPSFFDPAKHAPAQPIARHALGASDPALENARREMLGVVPAHALACAFTYDYGRREVVRHAGWDDPARVVANALAGFEPGCDLAEALVEQALDDGAQQKPLAAFGHAYTDRTGNVYPGITLYDAWSSGAEIEMPDVDTLGLFHTLRDDWKSFVAPISNQEPLYEALGEIFRDASRHRALRHALALVYLEGQPALGTYDGMLVNLHLAWEKANSTPTELLPTLPASSAREPWIAALIAEGRDKPEAWAAAELRRDTLARAGAVVRSTLLEGLQAFGAYKKLEAPPAEKH